MKTEQVANRGPAGGLFFDLETMLVDLTEFFSDSYIKETFGQYEVFKHDKETIWITLPGQFHTALAKIKANRRIIYDSSLRRLLRGTTSERNSKVRAYFLQEDDGH